MVQVSLPFGDGGRDRSTAVATAVATGVDDRSGKPVRHAVCSPDPPDPEDLKIQVGGSSRARATAVATVRHDPDRPPAWALEDAERLRPDLPEFIVRGMWFRFAAKTHRTLEDARDHFARWLVREDARGPKLATTARQNAPPAPDAPEVDVEPEEPATGGLVPPSGVREPLFALPRAAPTDDECLLPLSDRREIAKAQLAELMARLEREPEPRSMSA